MWPIKGVFTSLLLCLLQCTSVSSNECFVNEAQGETCPLSGLTTRTLIYPGGNTGCYNVAGNIPYRFQVQPGRNGNENKVVINFQGGGFCETVENCRNGGAREMPELITDGIFDSDNVDNTFADWTMVGVLYCSGDGHIGNAVSDDGLIRFSGQNNVNAVLDWIQSNLPLMTLENVVLSGTSAGGIGVIVWSNPILQMLNALPTTPPTVSVFIDGFLGRADSLGFNVNDDLGLCSQQTFGWTNEQFAECVGGTLSFSKLLLVTQAENRNTPFAYILSKSDPTLTRNFCSSRFFCFQGQFYGNVKTSLRIYNDAAPSASENNAISYLMNEAIHVSFPSNNFYTRNNGNGEPTLKEWVDSIIGRTPMTTIQSSCVPRRSILDFLFFFFPFIIDFSCDPLLASATFGA